MCVCKQDLETGFPGYWLRVFHMCMCVRVRKATVHWRFSPPEDSQFDKLLFFCGFSLKILFCVCAPSIIDVYFVCVCACMCFWIRVCVGACMCISNPTHW